MKNLTKIFLPYPWTGIAALVMYFLLCSPTRVRSQTTINGHIQDTMLLKDHANASIVLIGLDSTVIQFVRGGKDGSFVLRKVFPGSYRILVSHPSYLDQHTPMIEVADRPVDIGSIFLTPRPDSLAPVVVIPRQILPHMHGDTLEYNTGNIKTRVNANVEELLRRLPGVQVDEDGVITVNGKRIEKLLIDGQEFFSNDPTFVTKNFNADMIAKAQIFEKKSRSASFTGIDDGRVVRTLNLTLKEDSKKAYFLRTDAGGDTEGYYNLDGVFGSFNERRQLALMGVGANTGTRNFFRRVGGFAGGFTIGNGGNDPMGASAGEGIPSMFGAGMHYTDNWQANDGGFMVEYNFIKTTTDPFSTTYIRQTLPDSIYIQRQSAMSSNIQQQHTLNTSLELNPDSASTLRIGLNGNELAGTNIYNSNDSSSMNDKLVNKDRRSIQSNLQNNDFHSTILYGIRARKITTRSLFISADIRNQTSTANGYLHTINDFFQKDGSLLGSDTVDQRKDYNNKVFQLNADMNYVEPLWKNGRLGITYGIGLNQNRSIQRTFTRGDGKYNVPVDSLSSQYNFGAFTQRVSMSLQGTNGKFRYIINGQVQNYSYKQSDEAKSTVLQQRYFNFAPRIDLYYSIDKTSNLRGLYNGLTLQPSISQVQPVQNNNDPLHVVVGNPDLHPGFLHSFELNFQKFRNTMLNASIHWDITNNGFSTRTTTDSLGRQKTQTVNVNGTNNLSLSTGVSRFMARINLEAGMNASFNYAHTVNFVSDLLSRNSNYVPRMEVWLKRFVNNKYSVNIRSSYWYSFTKSSINNMGDIRYWTQRQTFELSAFPMADLKINTSINYDWRQKLDASDIKNSTLLWNASLDRSFFKNQFTISLSVYDILGQNSGINRSVYANQLQQTVQNIIGRYWLLSASWRMVRKHK